MVPLNRQHNLCCPDDSESGSGAIILNLFTEEMDDAITVGGGQLRSVTTRGYAYQDHQTRLRKESITQMESYTSVS